MQSLRWKHTVSIWLDKRKWEDEQESKREDQDDRHFCAWVHLHIPHEKYGQDAESPVCDGGHGGVCICDVREDGVLQTGSIPSFISCPEVVDGCALEEEEEEVHCAEEKDDRECNVDGLNLVFLA